MIDALINEWDLPNFRIKVNYILLAKPINGIAKITAPMKGLMPWKDAIKPKDGWECPTIKELETIFKIYGILNINNNLDLKPTKPVWSKEDNEKEVNALAFDFSIGNKVSKNKNDLLEVIYICHKAP